MILNPIFNPTPVYTSLTVSGLTPAGFVKTATGAGGLLSTEAFGANTYIPYSSGTGFSYSANLTFDITNGIICGNPGQFTQLGVGSAFSSIAGAVIQYSANLSNGQGVFGGVTTTRNIAGGNVLYGLDFQSSWVPASLAASRTFANLTGSRAGISATSPTGTSNMTVTNSYCYQARCSLVAGGTGTVSITTLYQFAAVASTLTRGSGAATIGTQFAFYDPGLTQATVNWGCAINTQSYFNASVSIGKNTAPAYPCDVVGDVSSSTLFRIAGTAGLTSQVVALAKLTPITGTDGSITVTGGIVTAYVAPT